MVDRILHLIKKTASTIALFALLLSFNGCAIVLNERNAVVEANPLPSAFYHIEITGNNQLIIFAYQADVLDIDGCAQWDGIATVGINNMAFQQDCQSVYSPSIQAKLRRGEWVRATATTPKNQLLLWLQEYAQGAGSCSTSAVPANSVLPLPLADTRTAITIHLPAATMDWNALCDAQLDSSFGSQSFLTDAIEGEVILCLDSETLELIGATFIAQQGQTCINGIIIMSASDGQTLDPFPEADTITDGALYEEWALLEP